MDGPFVPLILLSLTFDQEPEARDIEEAVQRAGDSSPALL